MTELQIIANYNRLLKFRKISKKIFSHRHYLRLKRFADKQSNAGLFYAVLEYENNQIQEPI